MVNAICSIVTTQQNFRPLACLLAPAAAARRNDDGILYTFDLLRFFARRGSKRRKKGHVIRKWYQPILGYWHSKNISQIGPLLFSVDGCGTKRGGFAPSGAVLPKVILKLGSNETKKMAMMSIKINVCHDLEISFFLSKCNDVESLSTFIFFRLFLALRSSHDWRCH